MDPVETATIVSLILPAVYIATLLRVSIPPICRGQWQKLRFHTSGFGSAIPAILAGTLFIWVMAYIAACGESIISKFV